MKVELDSLVVGIKSDQCDCNDDSFDIQFILFIGNQMFDDQCGKVDYNFGDDVIGQYNKYGCYQFCYCIDEISKIDFCYVIQYQQIDIYECWGSCVDGNEIREW